MSKWKLAIILALLSIIQGCNSTDEEVKTDNNIKTGVYISLEEFTNVLTENLSEDSINCGISPGGENTIEINMCVVSAFENSKSFYAIYKIQGVDSTMARATTMDASGIINDWFYGGNEVGVMSGYDSYYLKNQCDNPAVKQEYDDREKLIFECSNQESHEDFNYVEW